MHGLKCLVTSLYFLPMIPNVVAQTVISGRVIDEQSQPMPFANVALVNRADSAFIVGAVTKDNGTFSISTDKQDGLLKVSSVGYTIRYIDARQGNVGDIQIQPDNQTLGEVVVKGHRPLYMVTANGLQTNIEGTVLAQLGTANDVLSQLPFIIDRDNNLEVIGRGAPAIYIDNRKVNNPKELQLLKSDQIKNVEVMLNPNSRYASNVQSVIKITTQKNIDDGFGGSVTLYTKQKRELIHYEELNLNYRHKGLEVFATADFLYNAYDQNQSGLTAFIYNGQPVSFEKVGSIRYHTNTLEVIGGFNYQLSEHQTLCVKYTYDWDFDGHATTSYANKTTDDQFLSQTLRNSNGYTHYANIFYQNRFAEKSVLNLDGTVMKKNGIQDENEKEDLSADVNSNSSSNSTLYAVKAWLDTPLLGGGLTIGMEATSTENNQDFQMGNETVALSLPSTESKSRQLSACLFASYDMHWHEWSAIMGVRYEHVDFDYFVNGIKNAEQSKLYNNLFPSLSLSYSKNSTTVSLGYRTVISRPNYWSLRSNISYNSRYSYEGGNPALQPTLSQQLDLLFRYRDIVLDAEYRNITNDQMVYIQHYLDQPVVLMSPINIDRNRYSVTLSYSPTIHVWHPSWQLGIIAQRFSFIDHTYNHPQFVYSWTNVVTLPHDWTITFNAKGKSCGHWQAEYIHGYFTATCIVKKVIRDWDFYIGFTDLFKTEREKWRLDIADISYSKNNDLDYRGIYARVVYRFNAKRTKYRGGNAGSDEKNRL